MDIADKIKKIRESNNLTQNEFAKILFVSRTAVSKWELKKGYPSIESLKLISKNFNISLDELLSSSDVIDIANEEIKTNNKRNKVLLNGIIDIMSVLVFFLPLFAVNDGDKIVCLPFFYIKISTLRLALYISILSLIIIVGILEIINLKINNGFLYKFLIILSFTLFIIAIIIFVSSKEIYPSIFMLGLLVVKGCFEIIKK